MSKTYMDIEFPYKNKELRFFCFLPQQIAGLVLFNKSNCLPLMSEMSDFTN